MQSQDLMQPPEVFHSFISGALCSHKSPRWKRSFLLRQTLPACSSPAALHKAKEHVFGWLKGIQQVEKTSSKKIINPAGQRCPFITNKHREKWIWYSLLEECCKFDVALKVCSWPFSPDRADWGHEWKLEGGPAAAHHSWPSKRAASTVGQPHSHSLFAIKDH